MLGIAADGDFTRRTGQCGRGTSGSHRLHRPRVDASTMLEEDVHCCSAPVGGSQLQEVAILQNKREWQEKREATKRQELRRALSRCLA